MKKKIFLLVTLFLLVVGYSCQEEVSDIWNTEKNFPAEALNTEVAKQFFESNIHQIALPKTQNRKVSQSKADSAQHVHTKQCNHTDHAKTRDLPDIRESNIVPAWDERREWSDAEATYVEVPLTISGDKLYAHKIRKRKNEKTTFERVKPTCMLVFEQKRGSEKIECFMITLIGEKSYLKEHGKRMRKLHHRPNDGAFSGIVYQSHLNGKIKYAYVYTNGEKTHKIFRTSCKMKSNDSPENTFLSVALVDRSLAASTYSIDWEIEEYYCSFCRSFHTVEEGGSGCEVEITYCQSCNQNINDCSCCYDCHQNPCQCCSSCNDYPCTCNSCWICYRNPCMCNLCKVCYSEPCACGSMCQGCNEFFCVCCRQCGQKDCSCCKVCYAYPCTCSNSNPCNGPKCSTCNGLLTSPATRSGVCKLCDCSWWTGGHNRILNKMQQRLKLKYAEGQLDDIKQGSKEADSGDNQKPENSHIHAMREPGETIEQTINEMRNFFVKEIGKYQKDNNYVSLGMALHPIMDSYSPVHDFNTWEGRWIDYVPHTIESTHLYPSRTEQAANAIETICEGLQNKESPEALFDNWLTSYKNTTE